MNGTGATEKLAELPRASRGELPAVFVPVTDRTPFGSVSAVPPQAQNYHWLRIADQENAIDRSWQVKPLPMDAGSGPGGNPALAAAATVDLAAPPFQQPFEPAFSWLGADSWMPAGDAPSLLAHKTILDESQSGFRAPFLA